MRLKRGNFRSKMAKIDLGLFSLKKLWFNTRFLEKIKQDGATGGEGGGGIPSPPRRGGRGMEQNKIRKLSSLFFS